MKIQGFVISLARAVERQKQVEKICRACPIECEPLEAIDGSLLPTARKSEIVSYRQHWPHYPFQLRDGEVGVFLSHRKAWQEIISRNLDAGLILEDDIEIDQNEFGHAFSLALVHIGPDDYVKFPVPRRGRTRDASTNALQIKSPIVTPLGATSQLVSRGAAERLLELTETFDRPIDTFVQMHWVTGLTPQVISPSGIEEVSHRLGGSTIQQKNRALTETIYRNLKRPTYRIQVVAYSYLRSLGGSRRVMH